MLIQLFSFLVSENNFHQEFQIKMKYLHKMTKILQINLIVKYLNYFINYKIKERK